jgi:hypothetical protein
MLIAREKRLLGPCLGRPDFSISGAGLLDLEPIARAMRPLIEVDAEQLRTSAPGLSSAI